MITYPYICERCKYEFEEERSINSKQEIDHCPNCKAKEPDFHKNYQVSEIFTHVKEVKCVGIQSEINCKKWGKELTAIKNEEARNKYTKQAAGKHIEGGKPLGRKPKAPKKTLDLTKIKNIKKYIETGKTT